jgi:hypothetical protein
MLVDTEEAIKIGQSREIVRRRRENKVAKRKGTKKISPT